MIRTAKGDVERFDYVFFACHSDQALAILDGPTPEETGDPRRLPVSGERSRAAHGYEHASARTPRARRVELSRARRQATARRAHVRHEHAADAREPGGFPRHAESHGRHRSVAHPAHRHHASPGVHAGGRGRAEAPARSERPQSHVLLWRVLALRLPRRWRRQRRMGGEGYPRGRRARHDGAQPARRAGPSSADARWKAAST